MTTTMHLVPKPSQTASMTGVDLFAGAGGFTTGAEAAGVKILWAANHWPTAVDTHTKNHPETVHVCQDLHQANWEKVPVHDLLLASPSCQGHAHARGKDRPHHDASRSTAWAVVSCLEFHRSPICIVENVPEFLAWALYPAWKLAIESLGYQIATHVLDSADFGVPQQRVRMFLVLTRSRAPIELDLRTQEHIAIGPFINFERSGEGRDGSNQQDREFPKWSRVNTTRRSPKTLARIARGRTELGSRFVMPYYGSGSGQTGRSLARPLGTVTTRDRWAVVDGDWMRMLQPREYAAAMGFPSDYWLPKRRDLAIHLLGNAVCPPVVTELVNAVRRAA